MQIDGTLKRERLKNAIASRLLQFFCNAFSNSSQRGLEPLQCRSAVILAIRNRLLREYLAVRF